MPCKEEVRQEALGRAVSGQAWENVFTFLLVVLNSPHETVLYPWVLSTARIRPQPRQGRRSFGLLSGLQCLENACSPQSRSRTKQSKLQKVEPMATEQATRSAGLCSSMAVWYHVRRVRGIEGQTDGQMCCVWLYCSSFCGPLPHYKPNPRPTLPPMQYSDWASQRQSRTPQGPSCLPASLVLFVPITYSRADVLKMAQNGV